MLRQRAPFAAAVLSKDKAPILSDVSARLTTRAHGNDPVISNTSHLLDVYMGNADGAGRPFHTPTGASLMPIIHF
jgi:hypothetical protein